MTGNLRNALLIHNPNAGNGGHGRRRMLDEARRILSSGGIEAELIETRGPGDATEMAQRATMEGRQLVIACGGDGTLNEVVNGLADAQNGHRVPLALLPGGTANILAKELNLPWDIPGAAEKLIHGQIKEIALGLATLGVVTLYHGARDLAGQLIADDEGVRVWPPCFGPCLSWESIDRWRVEASPKAAQGTDEEREPCLVI